METKTCKGCGEAKPATLEFFHRSYTRQDGSILLANFCKPCVKSRHKERYYDEDGKREQYLDTKRKYQANRRLTVPSQREYERWAKIKLKYGLEREEFELLWENQGGCCAICRTPLEGARPCVDHQHETGAVRGLLCTPCNTGIGMLQDDPDVMIRAAAYVRNPIAQDATSVPAGEGV